MRFIAFATFRELLRLRVGRGSSALLGHADPKIHKQGGSSRGSRAGLINTKTVIDLASMLVAAKFAAFPLGPSWDHFEHPQLIGSYYGFFLKRSLTVVEIHRASFSGVSRGSQKAFKRPWAF